MTAVLLLAAIALDLALVFVASRTGGFSGSLGPLRIRLHDPSTLLVVAAVLTGCFVAATWRGRARGAALAMVVAVVGTAGIALTRSADRILPIGDVAVLEMYARNALAGHLMVGPYSRFGWHHPGPLYFYVLAPLYGAGGQSPAALAAGAATIAIASLALFVWISARSLGTVISAWLLVPITAYFWRVPDLAASAWNPHVIILPTVALVVTGAAVAGGDLALLPILVAVASLVVQTDVALVPVAGAVAALSAAAGLIAATRRGDGPVVITRLNQAAWLAAALWFIVAAEEVTHTPGNLTMLWRFFAGGASHGQTFGAAVSAWATMMAAMPRGTLALATGGTFEADGIGVSLILTIGQLMLLAGIAFVARRRGYAALGRLALVSLVASIVALWSATRIADRIMDHEVFWISGIGALNVGIIGALVVPHRYAAQGRFTPRRLTPDATYVAAWVHGALMAACVFICFTELEGAHGGRLPVTPTTPATARVAARVQAYMSEKQVRKPLVRIGEDVWGVAAGVLLELDRAGVPFAVEESWMPMFPQSFAANGDEDAELAFADTDEHLRLAGRPDNVLVASASTMYADAAPIAARRPR